ncbi:MAG: phenylalanine--tRNA ligase subunit alpha [Halobacteriota archaeon]|nr:phenylalanine--tRNA ligase subunit alpha [Halobacteriota archaeon]
MELTKNERIVLLALSDSSEFTQGNLAKATDLKIENALQAAFLLSEKGFARIDEEVHKSYSLTEEGEEYARDGLPERRAIIHVTGSGDSSSIAEMRAVLGKEASGIAIGWLKKKGWATIEKGQLSSSGLPPKGDDELILERLMDGSPIAEATDSEILDKLIKRNLITIEEKKDRIISITESGDDLAAKIGEEEDMEYINQLTSDMLKTGSWRGKSFRAYDVDLPTIETFPTKMNPYARILAKIRRIFLEMGFKEIRGEIIQPSFWNFDALFQPQDHPARDMHDTFYLDGEMDLPKGLVEKVRDMHEHGGEIGSTGWGGKWDEGVARGLVLRTHTTAHTIKYLSENPTPPAKVFCIARVYRREAIDSTHLPEFEQLEGIVMDEDVSFSNLLGCLSEFYEKMGFEVRFRPGYFPYTEPSVEAEIKLGDKWIELGGAGVFRKEVTNPLGIDSPVLAWGLGTGRLAIIKLGLTDLRDLYREDIDWLRKMEMSNVEAFM